MKTNQVNEDKEHAGDELGSERQDGSHGVTDEGIERRMEALRLAPIALAPTWHPLSHIDEYLQVKGWKFEQGHGWLPPQAFREAIGMQIGRGHLSRGIAIHLQVRWDETHPAFALQDM